MKIRLSTEEVNRRNILDYTGLIIYIVVENSRGEGAEGFRIPVIAVRGRE